MYYRHLLAPSVAALALATVVSPSQAVTTWQYFDTYA